MRRFALTAILACALCAQAQVLFKWVDAEGKTHYGDRVPKGHAGKVERIEPPEPLADGVPVFVAPAPPKPLPAAAEPAKAGPAPVDYGKRRRETRERLRADVVAAEERLEQAKARLSGGEATNEDERQTIQQIAGKPGSLPAAGRSNCRQAVAGGKAVVMCPAVIPNELYYERIKGLEEAVKAAEHDLDRAKEAYRRGVD